MTAQEILSKLVSFPVLGGQSNLSIMQWIKDFIEGFEIETHLVPNEEGTKASLHCRIGPSTDGGVILSGHMDVVPVEGQDWDTDPFVLTDKGRWQIVRQRILRHEGIFGLLSCSTAGYGRGRSDDADLFCLFV